MYDRKIVTRFLVLSVVVASLGFPGKAVASEELRVAVFPAFGDLEEEQKKEVTGELRQALRQRQCGLATQSSVKEAVSSKVSGEIPTVGEMIAVAQAVRASLILAPRLVSGPDNTVYFEIVSFNLELGRHRGYRVQVEGAKTISEATPEKLKPAIAVCVAPILDRPIEPEYASAPPAAQVDLSGLGHQTNSASGAPRPEKEDAFRPELGSSAEELEGPTVMESDATPSIWDRWYHKGVFVDLGFTFGWCSGDALCEDAKRGLGGRFRIGYRIASMFAISVGASVSAHEVPTSAEQVALLKRTFVWGGVHGGLRFHPVRKFFLDPFIGIDMGWAWMIHISQRRIDDATIQEDIAPGFTADDIASLEFVERTRLMLKGFVVVPQAGLRIFVTPGFSIGAVVEWHLPFWSNICAKTYEPTMDGLNPSQEVCSGPGSIESLALNEELAGLLSKEDALPKFMTAELDLVFLF